jgi:hypothetical protein
MGAGQALLNIMPLTVNYNHSAVASLPEGLPIIVYLLRLLCGDVCNANSKVKQAFIDRFQQDVANALTSRGFTNIARHDILVLNVADVNQNTGVQFVITTGTKRSVFDVAQMTRELSHQLGNNSSPLRANGVVTNKLDPDSAGVDVVKPVNNDNVSDPGSSEQTTRFIVLVSIGSYFGCLAALVIAYRVHVRRIRSSRIQCHTPSPTATYSPLPQTARTYSAIGDADEDDASPPWDYYLQQQLKTPV